nr:immunoglobulin light chain junction region [Macaca mulatta]MOX07500.1 immunoglobulin light chain junction region [Macaca mulatta]MOX09059.1 immunoglobulin light chain junction region [Macaca mulatta]
CQQGSSSPFSF